MLHVPAAQTVQAIVRGQNQNGRWANLFRCFAAGMDTQSGTQLFDFATDFENALASALFYTCLLYTSPSPRDLSTSRMPSSA